MIQKVEQVDAETLCVTETEVSYLLDLRTEAGAFLVETSSGSRYLLDLSNGTLTRNVEMHVGAPLSPQVPAMPFDYGAYDDKLARLRGDNTLLNLLAIPRLEVGEKAIFNLTEVSSIDGAVTQRRTTPVVSIVHITA